MVNLEVQLKSVEEIHDFVKRMNRMEWEADLVSGRSIVDAKSILGIFSVDLSKRMKLIVYSDDVKQIENDIGPYIIS